MRTYSALLAFRRLVATACGISKTGIRVTPIVTSNQAQTVGEDAYFITLSNTTSGFDICGVADGVGGWREVNVNPARFSRGLIDECARLAQAGKVTRPSELIKAAYEKVIHPTLNCYGGSTICLLALDRAEGILHTANLGDSGFMLLRNGRVLAKSSELQHYFNCPYQLTNPPPNTPSTNLILDSPSSAELTSLEVSNGDIVVMATDGFFDNVYKEEVSLLMSGLKDCSESSLMSGCAAAVRLAYAYSHDQHYQSPFAEKISPKTIGGKPDDITVVMAAVCGHG